MLAATRYVAFMLRFSNESESSPRVPAWRTEIEHVHTGEHWQFDQVDAAFEFLRHYVTGAGGGSVLIEGESVLQIH